MSNRAPVTVVLRAGGEVTLTAETHMDTVKCPFGTFMARSGEIHATEGGGLRLCEPIVQLTPSPVPEERERGMESMTVIPVAALDIPGHVPYLRLIDVAHGIGLQRGPEIVDAAGGKAAPSCCETKANIREALSRGAQRPGA